MSVWESRESRSVRATQSDFLKKKKKEKIKKKNEGKEGQNHNQVRLTI